jgi:hypothetical protein
MERMIDWHTGEFNAPVPTTYGCGMPSMMAPGQNAKFLLALIVRVLLDEFHVRVAPSSRREGVIHGRGRAPSVASSVKEERTRRSQGACPMGATSTVKSDTLRGLSVGVGTSSVCSRERRVSRAI